MGKLRNVILIGCIDMKNLVGQSFSLAGGRYRIVDVQRLGGDALVYAERVESASASGLADPGVRKKARTAFHYGDIARFLEDRPRA